MKKAVLARVLQKFSSTFDVQSWFEAPLGAEPFAVVPHGDGLAVLCIEDVGAVEMQFPVLVFPAGSPQDIPIGWRVGSFIGHCPVHDGEVGGTAFVFRAEPWPRTALEGAQTAGSMA